MQDDIENLPEPPSYQRQPKKNKQSKNSKSSNGFFPWLMKVGRYKFFQLYKRQYNQDVEDDRLLITHLWQAEKDPYVKEFKERKDKHKGVFRALGIDEIEVEGSTMRSSFDSRPPNAPFPIRRFGSDECLERHERTITGENDMMDRLRFLDAQKTDFSSVVLQFISVYPYTVALSTNKDVLVYPAEIAITHYTLEQGVGSCFSKLINFHPRLFYGSGVPSWDHDNVEKKAKTLDVSLKEPQGASPELVWKLLMERRSPRAITVCDENEIWLVDRALYFLASTAGPDQLSVHRELVAGIVTVQDLIAALASHHTRVSKDPAQDILTRERITQEFKRMRETTSCCAYHDKRPPNHQSRQLCPVAKTALLIDAICTLCISANLANFRTLYMQHPELHTVGVVQMVGGTNEEHGLDEEKEDMLEETAAEASSESSSKGFQLWYEVVDDSEKIFPRKQTVNFDLTDVTLRMVNRVPGLMGSYL
ncbi:hypothetical protein V3C99_010956 [Haemonchus contortus]|uniref:Maelstrom domain-containing protein n=1 Tax=Haemonchus contortus TaxID=6289 RepID=A0A7I4Y8H2_HAECO